MTEITDEKVQSQNKQFAEMKPSDKESFFKKNMHMM